MPPKKQYILFGKRYWPAHGGVETYIQQTARALMQQGRVTIITHTYNDSHPTTPAGLYCNAPSGSFYEDTSGNRVVPLSPSIFQRLILIPLLVLGIPRIANFKNGALRKPLFWFFKKAFHKDWKHHCTEASAIISFEGNYWGMLASEMARELDVPFFIFPFVHPHHWGDDQLNLSLYQQANAIITACDYEIPWFVDHGCNPDRVTSVGGYPEEKKVYSIKKEFGIAGPLVLFYARKDHYKGHTMLMQAWETVAGSVPDAWCAFVGPGFIRTIDPYKRIICLPPVDGSPVADCDIFCMPSKSETFGLVYIEAWAHAKPVIACAIPSSRELFHGQDAGFLIDGSIEDCAKRLEILLKDKKLQEKMGQAGLLIQQKYYSKRAFEDTLMSIVTTTKCISGY